MNLNETMKCGMLNAPENEIKIERENKELITMKLFDELNEENGVISKVIDGKETKMNLPKKLKDLLKDNIINESKDVIRFWESKMKLTIVKRGLNENILYSIGYCGGIEIAELLHQINESTPILKDVIDHYENVENDDIQRRGNGIKCQAIYYF